MRANIIDGKAYADGLVRTNNCRSASLHGKVWTAGGIQPRRIAAFTALVGRSSL